MSRLVSLFAAAAVAILAVAVVAIVVQERDDQDAVADLPAPPSCEPGARDRNPNDRRVEPSRGKPLIARRNGHLPIGLNDSSHQRGWVSLEQALELYRQAAMSLTRLPLNWGAVEKSPGELDFSQYDEIYCGALAAGVRPLWHVTGVPGWAAPLGTCNQASCVRPPEDEHLHQLERFAEIAAIRYPRSAAFEAWNEPNLRIFWGDVPDPWEYLPVLEAIYTGTKNGNPGMPVLDGALSNNPTDSPGGVGLSLRTYLDAILAGGAARFMDGFGLHAYPLQPLGHQGDQFTPAMRASRELLAAEADGIRIWVTEVGVPTVEGGRLPSHSPEEQAVILSDTYSQLDRSDDTDAVLFHSLMDVPPGQAGILGFGFFSQPDDAGTVTVKPVVCALRTLTEAPPEGCPETTQL